MPPSTKYSEQQILNDAYDETTGSLIVTSGTGTAGTPATGVTTVQGATGMTPVSTNDAPTMTAAAVYRSAVVAADVMAAPGTVTCTKLTGVGALTANTYYVKVVAGNVYGRTTATAGDTTVTTETTNLGIRAAFAAVSGATFYDIYCTTASDPLFVGRITEAQRASGIIIDTVNHTTAGGTAGAVDIYPVGTGAASATNSTQNNAYVIPASPIVTTGYRYLDIDVAMSRTGDIVASALAVIPFYVDVSDSTYYQGDEYIFTFGGASGIRQSNHQRLRLESRGSSAVAVLVSNIAGTGASVDLHYSLS